MDGDDASLGIENPLLSAIKSLGGGGASHSSDGDLLADGATATKFARGPSSDQDCLRRAEGPRSD